MKDNEDKDKVVEKSNNVNLTETLEGNLTTIFS